MINFDFFSKFKDKGKIIFYKSKITMKLENIKFYLVLINKYKVENPDKF